MLNEYKGKITETFPIILVDNDALEFIVVFKLSLITLLK